MAHLRLEGIGKRYGDAVALEGIDLEVESGEFLVLVGPSGCGKSTLLRIVAGLVPHDGGRVVLGGEDVSERGPRERDVAMVFQNYALYPHMTVRGNLEFPLKLAKRPKDERRKRVQEAASVLGLAPLLDRKPSQLSGGQMQRVALGRAIVRDPRLFLFDEPLSNLDAKLREEMRGEIRRLHERLGITTLYVTHDQAEAMTMGSRVCVLDGGRIQQVGTPLEVFDTPRTTFVGSFLGSPPMNLLRGRVSGATFEAGTVRLAAPGVPEGEVVLGVRPHRVVDDSSPEAFELTVQSVETLGTSTRVQCDAGGQELVVTRDGHVELAAGARIRLGVPSEDRHWFDAKTGERLSPG